MQEKLEDASRQLKFRSSKTGRDLSAAIGRICREIGRDGITIMHVCGSHEQALAKYGLRSALPPELDLIMGPGCPVCVTDLPEVDEAVALAESGVRIVTYGDMLRVPGSSKSLADARATGAKVDIVYGVHQAVELARKLEEEVVFFATGFETTAVATAAALLGGVPDNFLVLSAHKYVPPAMELVARIPGSRVEGFLAAGHAATITGWGIFADFAAKHGMPVVVAGFEPLDILAGVARLLELVRDRKAVVDNMYPRCVTRDGNQRAQEAMWKVFETMAGRWRGIAEIPDGNLRLREEWSHSDARKRFKIDMTGLWTQAPRARVDRCICGNIMAGLASPRDCELFGHECTPEDPVGACMVSSEGSCRIWHHYGGHPDLSDI